MKNITIDLHGMPLSQVQREIHKILKNCSKDTNEIEIIHGYNNGDRILKYIRNELKHPRIDKKILGMNNGITTIILKK